MRKTIISFANRAHRQPSAWVRRPAIVLAIIGLAIHTIGFWLMAPFLVVLIIVLSGLKELVSILIGLPGEAAQSARDDWRDWKINLAGAIRIWRAQKVEPELVRDARAATPTPEKTHGE